MIRRITLENYMSHARTVIEPANGLTVLVGPNNCGKSAVVSALLSVCGETEAAYMVRHGEKLATVTIETDDDETEHTTAHTIVWRRKKGSASYVIDGREIHRIGKGNLPDGLHDLLKMPRIESRGIPFQVHFGVQKDPIFLLGDEKKTAAFFSSSAEAERLLEMQKLHAQKERQAKSDQRATLAEIGRLEEKLKLLEPLDGLADPLVRLESAYADRLAESAAIDALEQAIARIERAVDRTEQIASRLKVLEPIQPPPAMNDVAPLERVIGSIDQLAERARRLSADAQAMASLAPPPVLADITPLEKQLGAFERYGRELAVWRMRSRATETLDEPPMLADEQAVATICDRIDLLSRAVSIEASKLAATKSLRETPTQSDPQPLAGTIRQLTAAHQAVEKSHARTAAMAALAEPPTLADPTPTENFVDRFSATATALAKHQATAEKLARQQADVERQIVDWVTQNPLCPTCGAAMESDRLLSGGHTHA